MASKEFDFSVKALAKTLSEGKRLTLSKTEGVHIDGRSPIRSGSKLLTDYEDEITCFIQTISPGSELFSSVLDPKGRVKFCEAVLDRLREIAYMQKEAREKEIMESEGYPPVDDLTLWVEPVSDTNGRASTFFTYKKEIKIDLSEVALRRIIDKDTFDERFSRPKPARLGYVPFGPTCYTDEDIPELYSRKSPSVIPTFNTWRAPDIDWEGDKGSYPATIRKFLNYLLCGDEEQLEVMYWFLKQHLLGHKVHNILYLLGRQGIGKTALFERFLATLLGSQNVRPVDFKKMVRSGFNAELEDLHVAYNDESPMDKSTANMLKSLTNGTYLSSPKFRTPKMQKAKFSICILANPDEVVIPLVPNSRRNLVLKHPDVKMKAYFGDEETHRIWSDLANLDAVGEFARWLLNHKTKYLDGKGEITFKGEHYYESVLQSYRFAYEGELVEAFIAAGKREIVKTSHIKINNKKINYEAVKVFLDQWEEAGFNIGELMYDENKPYFISNVSSRDEFLVPTRKPFVPVDSEEDFDIEGL